MFTITHTLGTNIPGVEPEATGLMDEDLQGRHRADRRTTQTSMGGAVSEISIFPAVALSSINP